MVFSRSAAVPDGVGIVLQGVQDSSNGSTVMEVLSNLSLKLQRHLASGTVDEPYSVESDVDPMDVDESNEDEDPD